MNEIHVIRLEDLSVGYVNTYHITGNGTTCLSRHTQGIQRGLFTTYLIHNEI